MTGKKTLRVVLAALSLALLASAAAQGGGVRAHYIFRGHLLATPPANATSISLTVEGGNRIALKAMLGASVDQNFAVGTGTEFLRWSHGVPTVVHANDLRAGDWAVVNVRAPYGSSLAQVESRPAGIVADRGAKPNPPTYPLFLFRGRVAAPAGTSTLSVDVRGGNRRALRLLLGNTRQQSFTSRYHSRSIFPNPPAMSWARIAWNASTPSCSRTQVASGMAGKGARLTPSLFDRPIASTGARTFASLSK